MLSIHTNTLVITSQFTIVIVNCKIALSRTLVVLLLHEKKGKGGRTGSNVFIRAEEG
jgi:hypothetical protein